MFKRTDSSFAASLRGTQLKPSEQEARRQT
jgi:hypothetical protein